jgi:membrane protein implicated in regulation of membrane protease activity
MEYLSPSIMWLLAAVLLLLVELLTPGLFFFISFAFGSLFGALAAVLGYSFWWQSGIALGISLIQFFAMRRRLKQFTDSVHAPTNVHALQGKKGVVLAEISPLQSGSVKVGGEQWAASSSMLCAEGAVVKVLRIEGNRLVVSLDITKE